MKCPKCGHPREESWTECARCGLIFSKYREKPLLSRLPPARTARGRAGPPGFLLQLPGSSRAGLHGRAVLLLLLFTWSWWFISNPVRDSYALRSFMHLVNLPFHEAGHVFASPFGALTASLGGSLMQLFMPLAIVFVFLFSTRDAFAAAVALWWTGESLMDLAPYIDDARSLSLPLIGGNTGATAPYGFHDWNFILNETHLLERDHLIARLTATTGALVMLASIIWAASVLLARYRSIMSHRA